jgi:hypothetical protein
MLSKRVLELKLTTPVVIAINNDSYDIWMINVLFNTILKQHVWILSSFGPHPFVAEFDERVSLHNLQGPDAGTVAPLVTSLNDRKQNHSSDHSILHFAKLIFCHSSLVLRA